MDNVVLRLLTLWCFVLFDARSRNMARGGGGWMTEMDMAQCCQNNGSFTD